VVELAAAAVPTLPSPGRAQIGPSYACGNAKTEYNCKLWVELCNRGNLDVNAVVGWHHGRDGNLAKGFTPIRRKECAMVSQELEFNLAFIAYVDGKPVSLELDSKKREITYYQSAGLINAAAGERTLSGRGGNGRGRTCVPSGLSGFSTRLASWDEGDSCPKGYVPVPLSNYFKASIDNWDPLTGTVNFYLYIYPKPSHATPLPSVVSEGARIPSLVKYKRGQGAPEDPAQAAAFYRRLGEKGDKEAQYKLGDLYFHGDGVQRDLILAYTWYYLAASRDHREASLQRRKLLMILNKQQQRVAMRRVNELRDGGADPVPQFFAPEVPKEAARPNPNPRRTQGSKVFPSGAKYEGELVDGYPDGSGLMDFGNGEKYDGEWTGRDRTGLGTLYLKDSSSCTGSWYKGKLVGVGKGMRGGVEKPCYPFMHRFTFDAP
jgi:hypothetical protein